MDGEEMQKNFDEILKGGGPKDFEITNEVPT